MAQNTDGAPQPQASSEATTRQLQQALALHRQNRFAEARPIYESVLAEHPQHVDALQLFGALALQTGDLPTAVLLIGQAIAIQPHSAALHNNLGSALLNLGRLDEALASFERALQLNPDQPETLYNRSEVLFKLGRPDEALVWCDKALALKPESAEAHNGRGSALTMLGRADEGLTSFETALAIKPHFTEAWNNRGNALLALKRPAEALTSFDKALALRPDYAESLNNRGVALRDLGRPQESLASFESALAAKPDQDFVLGTVVHTHMQLCDWTNLSGNLEKIRAGIQASKTVIIPFQLLALLDDPGLHRRATDVYMRRNFPKRTVLGPYPRTSRKDRIRIGYYSADFCEHATAYLITGLFELHDRTKFEIVGLSFGPDKQDAMRKRTAAAVDQFIDVRDQSDRAIAVLSRELGIDIAVDLMGCTQGMRTGIFALGCAPIQVNYLGYPGTMGGDYIDYIIADSTVIPAGFESHTAEKVVRLPHSYQVNDTQRKIADRIFTRTELGLPETGFVFCCFNNNYKVLPDVFGIWMRLLKGAHGSVLWLLEDNPAAAANLRKEAAARGVDPARLVFAKRMATDQHLARHKLADLFLDTLPYNAHTTASDALWCGLPVLTCTGSSFAGRVAASLLRALDMPELVTDSLPAYEAKARALASDPAQIAAIKTKLAANRLTSPLFNARLFARHLETGYATMYARHLAGLAPEHFAVS